MNCPIIKLCNGITEMNCHNRNFSECDYFKNELAHYCEKHSCPCHYIDSCQRPRLRNTRGTE